MVEISRLRSRKYLVFQYELLTAEYFVRPNPNHCFPVSFTGSLLHLFEMFLDNIHWILNSSVFSMNEIKIQEKMVYFITAIKQVCVRLFTF